MSRGRVVTVRLGKVSQQWDETQIHRHWRFNHQYLGRLDEKQKKIQREKRLRTRYARVRSGSASHIPLAHFDLQGMSVHNDREYVLLSFPSSTRSINNLPLFLFDVNMKVLYTIEASFQCTRRNEPTNRRVFLAADPRFKKPATSIVVNDDKKNRLDKTLFTWEQQSVAVQSDSFAGLTNHVSTRSDKLSEEKIVQDIVKPAEQRLNSTIK